MRVHITSQMPPAVRVEEVTLLHTAESALMHHLLKVKESWPIHPAMRREESALMHN